MAASINLKDNGANSATFYVTGISGGFSLDSVQWAQLQSGALKDFVTGSYLTGTAVYEASAEVGGSVSVIAPNAAVCSWSTGGDDEASLDVLTSATLLTIKLSVSYSASK